MSGYAASSPDANAAYNTPVGSAPIAVGTATFHFLKAPMTFSAWEFIGVAFIIFVAARHWGRFVNQVAT